MKIKVNTFKQQVLSGKPSYGLWNGIPHPYAAEICAGAGFDWICVDGEHAPFDQDTLTRHMQVIEAQGISAIIRIPTADPVRIKQLLDVGVQNVLCPMIESADEADLIARAMLYPPAGIRGVGTALARAAQWGRVEDYLHLANAQMCCLAQIESIKGVDALDEILEVEGIHVFFIGPADLAASMGYLGQADHPEVVKVVKNCIQKIIQASKVAGFLTVSEALIESYSNAGAMMRGVGLDTLLLAKASENLATKYKA